MSFSEAEPQPRLEQISTQALNPEEDIDDELDDESKRLLTMSPEDFDVDAAERNSEEFHQSTKEFEDKEKYFLADLSNTTETSKHMIDYRRDDGLVAIDSALHHIGETLPERAGIYSRDYVEIKEQWDKTKAQMDDVQDKIGEMGQKMAGLQQEFTDFTNPDFKFNTYLRHQTIAFHEGTRPLKDLMNTLHRMESDLENFEDSLGRWANWGDNPYTMDRGASTQMGDTIFMQLRTLGAARQDLNRKIRHINSSLEHLEMDLQRLESFHQSSEEN